MDKSLESNPWITNNQETIYESPWIKVNKHEVINPSGNPAIYSTIEFKNIAIGILPLDEHYNTWIVGQYRYPINQYSWEIPEGGGDPGISPIISAQRELKEETGIVAKDYIQILDMYLSNSASNERAVVYVAKGLKFEESSPEETEILQVKKIPFDTLFQMVCDGEISDSITITAVLKTKWLIDTKAI